eukprot:s1509_g17.t1
MRRCAVRHVLAWASQPMRLRKLSPPSFSWASLRQASTDSHSGETLRCSSNTDVAQLAASIKHRILECETCDIDCLGPESVFRSLSAMHLAMVFVKRERSEERTLCLRPEEMHVTSGDAQNFSDADQIGQDAKGRRETLLRMRMNVFLSHWHPSALESEEFLIGPATHVGLAAGLFASLLKDGAEVVVAAGRAPAAARAIKVLAATNVYLTKQGCLTGKIFLVALRWDRAPRGYVNRVIFTSTLLTTQESI